MKKYNNYKNSGIEWIGKIPEHWEILRGKEILKFKNGYPFASNLFTHDKNEGFPLIRIRDLKSIDFSTFYKGDIISDALIENEDLIIGMDGDFNIVKWNKGQALLNQRLCKISGHKNLNTNFLYYCLPYYLKIINDLTYFTTVKHLSNNDLFEKKYVIPSIEEQISIVNFLNHKTAQIDTLIAKKEQFIILLQEELTAVINEAVTKGLDSNAKMKDSNIEWLGEIPEHWNVTKIKHQFNVQGGGTPSKENPSYWDGDIPWVSPKDMKQKEIIDTIDKTNLLGISNSASKIVEPESLLMVVRSGILQRTIPIGINKLPVSLNQDIKSFTSKGSHSIHLLYYLIKGRETQLLEDWTKEGATVESIEMEYLLNFSLPIPPSNEQRDIVKFIEGEEKSVLTIINKAQQEIELLKEYKTALISEVVTGKVNVQNIKLN